MSVWFFHINLSLIYLILLLHHDQEDGVDITANSLHPGTIVTNLFRHNSAVNGKYHCVIHVNSLWHVEYELCRSQDLVY
jgi:hypothetical protein